MDFTLQKYHFLRKKIKPLRKKSYFCIYFRLFLKHEESDEGGFGTIVG